MIKRLLLLLVWTVSFHTFFGNEVEVTANFKEINLNAHCEVLVDSKEGYEIGEVQDLSDWRLLPPQGPMFSLSFNSEWVKVKMNNTASHSVEGFVFFPYHLIKHVDIYHVAEDGTLLKKSRQGRRNSHESKSIASRGYNLQLEIPEGTSSIYVRLNNNYDFLRAPIFLMSERRLHDVINRGEHLIWLWRGIIIVALAMAVMLFINLRQRLFLYYTLFNAGVVLYVSSELGEFQYLDFGESFDLTIHLSHFGSVFGLMMLPFFINEMIPLSKLYPRLWKVMFIAMGVPAVGSILSLFPGSIDTVMRTVTMLSIVGGSLVMLMTLLFMLLRSTLNKEKNALTLFLVYLFYIATVFVSAYLPNFALIEEGPFTFSSMLIGSMLEVLTFLFLMGKGTFDIYEERAQLLEKEGDRQRELSLATIKSQEEERNNIGRELHDMIGANLSLISEKVDPADEKTKRIVEQTLSVVRKLSHGLVTPGLKGKDFEDEVKELCHGFSSTDLSFEAMFYEWPSDIEDQTSTHLYRICQELFQNAVKHSKASSVHVQLIGGKEELQLIYEDNGVGFELERNGDDSLGIKNIENRVSILSGELLIDSNVKRGGTTFIVTIPRF